MPGPQVTDRQMRIYMNHRQSEAPAVAAARAGFSAAKAAPFPVHGPVLLELVPDPVIAPRPAPAPVPGIVVPDTPPLVIGPVPVHHSHHLVRSAAGCEARDTRRSRSPSIPSSP